MDTDKPKGWYLEEKIWVKIRAEMTGAYSKAAGWLAHLCLGLPQEPAARLSKAL